jgi:hypothetical protein
MSKEKFAYIAPDITIPNAFLNFAVVSKVTASTLIEGFNQTAKDTTIS